MGIKKARIGIALGGGAARGLAHVGFLKVLEEEGFPIHVIAGTSMGAIVGGKYALAPSWKVLEEDVFRFLESDLFRKAHLDFLGKEDEEEKGRIFFSLAKYLSKKIYHTLAATQRSLVKDETFRAIIAFLFPEVPIEYTRIPFAASGVDLCSGEEVILKRGPIREAVAASCALPGVLPPVRYNGMELIDGAWLDQVPGSVARSMGADFVIGVWVGKEMETDGKWINSIEILARADEITRHYLALFRLKECDFVVTPRVGEYCWADFEYAKEIIKEGERAATEALPELKKAIRDWKVKRFFPSPFR